MNTVSAMTNETSSPQLADELKSELTVIIGQCEMLEDVLSTQADPLAHIKAIKAVALRMADKISHQPWMDVSTHAPGKRKHRAQAH